MRSPSVNLSLVVSCLTLMITLPALQASAQQQGVNQAGLSTATETDVTPRGPIQPVAYERLAQPADGGVQGELLPVQWNVAVIDVNLISKEVGLLAAVQASLKNKQQEVTDRLGIMELGYKGKLEEAKKRYGETLTAEQQKEIEEVTRGFNTSLLRAGDAGRKEIAAFENQLKLHIVEEIRPIAYQIARERGFSIVLTTQQIFAAGPDVNLTATVIERYKATHPQAAPTKPEQIISRGGEFKSAR